MIHVADYYPTYTGPHFILYLGVLSLYPIYSVHILNLATFLHLDMSIYPCQPSWRTFSSQTSPSGTTFPMRGVPPVCPPHPISTIPTFAHTVHVYPLWPTWPLPRLCAHLCTLPHTSMHLVHHFSWVFSYTHFTSCALAHSHLYPMANG